MLRAYACTFESQKTYTWTAVTIRVATALGHVSREYLVFVALSAILAGS